MTNYIYGLRDPRDGKIKYVGKTRKPSTRLCLHVCEARKAVGKSTPKKRWIAELLAADLKPEMVILETVTGFAAGALAEARWTEDARSKGEIFNIYPLPLNNEERRRETVAARLTQPEKAIIQDRASEAGISESDAVRLALGFPA